MENVYENNLFKDGLNLQNLGKKILSHNFIVNLQTYGTFWLRHDRTWSKINNKWCSFGLFCN